MEIQRNVASGNAWGDTNEVICDIFPPANRQLHIYKRIRGFIGGNTNLGFFRLISKIFQGTYSKPLPRDLVPEIVSRLPAEDVLKCIMVCKGWMDVTLTPHFFDLHQSRAPPVILVQNFDLTNDMKLYSLDLTRKEPYIRRFDTTKLLDCRYYLVGTFDGLLLLSSQDSELPSFRLSIYNPLTGRILAGVTVEGDYCCGFWFHPSKGEYLFLTTTSYRYFLDRGYCYKIFNLKGDSTVLGWYDTLPTLEVPIHIRHSLHFVLRKSVGDNCIMMFNIETETVDFKPHPHSGHCVRGHDAGGFSNEDMRLLEIEGSLAFAHVCLDTKSLYLWILVDRATWHWIERYKINLNWCYGRQINLVLHPLSVQKGEMLMLYKPNRLIAVNLETRLVRKMHINIVCEEGCKTLISTIYRSSFVGLNRLAHI